MLLDLPEISRDSCRVSLLAPGMFLSMIYLGMSGFDVMATLARAGRTKREPVTVIRVSVVARTRARSGSRLRRRYRVKFRGGTMAPVIRLLGQPEIINGESDQTGVRGHLAWALLARILLSEISLERRSPANELFPDAVEPLGSLRWCLAA